MKQCTCFGPAKFYLNHKYQQVTNTASKFFTNASSKVLDLANLALCFTE